MSKRAATYARVATYARLSTEDQAKHGYSLPWQTEACRKYAKERGWTVVTEISDDGVSGATLDRPGLDRIRDMAHAGEIDAVIVYDVDRLGRKAVCHRPSRRSWARQGSRSTTCWATIGTKMRPPAKANKGSHRRTRKGKIHRTASAGKAG